MSPIRVAIIEDDPGYALSLETMLKHAPGFEWLATYGTIAEAIRELPSKAPRVTLVDLGLPDGEGQNCIRILGDCCPSTRPLVLSKYDDDARIFAAILAGAFGYVLKSDGPRALLDGIEAVAGGLGAMSPSIARRAIGLLRGRTAPQPPDSTRLTNRDLSILDLVKQGLANKEIAGAIGIAPHTVANCLTRIYTVLHVSGRRDLPRS